MDERIARRPGGQNSANYPGRIRVHKLTILREEVEHGFKTPFNIVTF
jgi:hypothetical protein